MAKGRKILEARVYKNAKTGHVFSGRTITRTWQVRRMKFKLLVSKQRGSFKVFVAAAPRLPLDAAESFHGSILRKVVSVCRKYVFFPCILVAWVITVWPYPQQSASHRFSNALEPVCSWKQDRCNLRRVAQRSAPGRANPCQDLLKKAKAKEISQSKRIRIPFPLRLLFKIKVFQFFMHSPTPSAQIHPTAVTNSWKWVNCGLMYF